MRLINEKELLAIAGGESNGESVTTTTSTNGTTTSTISFPNGTLTTVVTRPDGHGTVIMATTTMNDHKVDPSSSKPEGAKGGRSGGGGRGGTSNQTTVIHFGTVDWGGLFRAY
jgi:hypothetical protein